MASILVVDRDPETRARHIRALEQDGHQVSFAVDGPDALEAVRAAPPLLIVCDLDVAGLGAAGVLRQLKSDDDPAVAHVPVLVTSEVSSDADEIRSGIEGALVHLVQPIAPGQLCSAVMRILGGGPEAEQRRRVQAAALERLSRHERGDGPDLERGPRLTRLERADRLPPEPRQPTNLDLSGLTEKQRILVDALRQAPSVAVAASILGVSRSNVYASLRRISRKLDTGSVPALLHLIRTNELRS